MDISDDIKNITEDHNELIESLIPDRVPSAELLMQKRGDKGKYYLKAGRLGFIYLLLIVTFTSFSFFMIDTLSGKRETSVNLIPNAGIFSADTPGSMVSAFREIIK